jgi:surface protein
MQSMFSGATAFNQPIGNWNTASVTNMQRMFSDATAFNQDISNWNTANVTDMQSMFSGATAFNQPIGNWNTASVTNMQSMFSGATAFNQPIGNWNTANVTNMQRMFSGATAFNQDISNWNTANVTNMQSMFSGATAFNQNLGNWNLRSIARRTGRGSSGMINMLNNCGMDIANYEATLQGWAAQTSVTNHNLGAAGLRYCNATHRNTLTGRSWIISGDAACNQHFRTNGNVNFTAATNWESSADNLTWAAATSAPNFNDLTITIRSGHTATVTANVSLDELVIADGGTVTIDADATLTIVDGTGVDIDIQSTGSVTGAGNFNLSSGATLRTARTDGLAGSITNTGTKTFAAGVNYVFNGTAAQSTGFTGLTIGNPNVVTISNTAAAVTLDLNNLSLSGALSVDANANFTIGAGITAFTAGSIANSGTVNNCVGATISPAFASWSPQGTYNAPTAEPTTEASGIGFTAVTGTYATISWTNGNGARRVVVVKPAAAVSTTALSDNTSYAANSVFGSGDLVDATGRVVFNGTGTTVSISGLTAGTTYHVAVFEYNENGCGINYKTGSPLAGNFVAVAPAPPRPVPPLPSGLNLTTQPVLQNTVFNPQSGLINPQMQLQNGSAAQRTVSGPIEPVFDRGQFQGYRITGAGTVCFTFFGEANTNSRTQVCFNVAPVACGAIEFAALTNVPWNTNGQPLNATAACGTVNFRVVSGLADIVENIVRPFPRSAGTVTVEASVSPASLDVNRDGVADFIASAPIQRTFRVLPIAQTITFNNLSVPRADVGIRLSLSAFASSGLPVTLTVVSGNGRIENNMLLITGGGEIVIEATQGGNEAWLPATPVRRSIEGVVPPRIRQSQVLTFNLPPNNLQNGFALSATASSNLPVSFTVVEGGAFARIDNNSLVIVNRPTTVTRITIEATQGGNDDFNPAAPVRRSFQLLPSVQSGGPTVLLSTGTLCQGSSIRAQLAGNFGADVALRLIVSDNQGNFNGGEGFIDARLEGNNTLVGYQTSNLATGTYRVRIDVATADGTIIGTPSAASFQLVAGNQLLGIEEGVSATGTRTLRSPIATGNSWTRDGQAVGNGQMIEAAQPGWYVLTVQAGNCTFTATTFVSANGRVEAEESAATTSEGRNGFKVYPNPGKGVFTLQGRQSVDGEAEVIISDMQGRIISRQSISGRQMNEVIDLGGTASGVYLLQIRQADGKVWTEKLVKE